MSTTCTSRNEVGVLPCQERGSAQIAAAKRGQITQLHTPANTRKTDHRRDSTTGAEYAAPVGGRNDRPGWSPPQALSASSRFAA
ncbi:MAG: hypothetical protein JWP76_4270 [Dactylosporangium sp.]|jgi:hypothetical protein|nr:hypothetical protein [Dactylosporangium sp.]